MDERKERRCHLTGWWVFVGSALFFIIAGFRSGDPLTIIGGALFLLGCLIFLYPMAWSRRTCAEPEQARTMGAARQDACDPAVGDVWRDSPACCTCGHGRADVPRNGPGVENGDA